MRASTSGLYLASGTGRAGAVATVALVLALVLAGCSGQAGGKARYVPPSSGDGGEAVASDDIATGLTRWPPANRPRLPQLRGRTLDGTWLDVSDWRGRVVVVNTWGSWCGPCRKEAPDLRRASQETRAAGVRFVGIDTRDNNAAARAFTREFAISYPSLVDHDGRVMLAFGRTIPVSAVPTTVVVDDRGRIAARVIGAATYPTLRGLVDDTLAERAPSRAGHDRTPTGTS
ncbi:MAG: TlpA family protein disulfide reductase [Actinomycetes bacterium]